MGFATGFTSGVTLTLSLAYLSVRAHQHNRERQAQSLRNQAIAIQQLLDPIPEPLPPTRSEVAAAQRQRSIELVKDRWNQEVENAVRWVQHTDWNEVRESAEAGARNLWHQALSDPEGKAGKAFEEAKASLQKATAEAKAAAEMARRQGRRKSQEIGSAASQAVTDGKGIAQDAATNFGKTAETGATEAKSVFASAIELGRDAASRIAEQARAVAGGIVDSANHMAPDATTAQPDVDPVSKALSQRYQKPVAKDNQTVAQALQERYIPIDKRDNTALRGI